MWIFTAKIMHITCDWIYGGGAKSRLFATVSQKCAKYFTR